MAIITKSATIFRPAIFFFGLILMGCNVPPPDVPPGYTLQTDLVEGGLYRVKTPLFVISTTYEWSGHVPKLLLIPEHWNEPGAPQTVEEYEREGSRQWPQVLEVLPAGTIIRYQGTHFTFNIEEGAMRRPLFEVVGSDPASHQGSLQGFYILRGTATDDNPPVPEVLLDEKFLVPVRPGTPSTTRAGSI